MQECPAEQIIGIPEANPFAIGKKEFFSGRGGG